MRYSKVDTIQAAIETFQASDEARYLAGGMTLLPTIRNRLVAPDNLIDLATAVGNDIRYEDGTLIIGAMATHHQVATSPLVQTYLAGLAALAGGIGDRQVRVRGTIGGSVANNDPAACYPAALLALGAVIETNQRTIPADDYFIDLFETALDESEVIVRCHIPVAQKAAYVKAPNPASRYALVGVFVAQFADEVRVAITGAGEAGVFFWHEASNALSSDFSASALDDMTASEDGLMSDIHASAAFRAHMMKTMTQQAVSIATTTD